MKKAIVLLVVLALGGASVYAFQSPGRRAHAMAAIGAALHPGKEVVVPSGTGLALRLEDRLSTDESHAGDDFHASVTEPVMVGGSVAIPAGAQVSGHVLDAEPAGHVSGHGRLQLFYDELTVGPEHVLLQTRGVAYESGSGARRSAGYIGGGAALGGLIGGGAGHSAGSAVGGALLGGAAGTAASMASRRPDLVFQPGTLLHLRLDHDVSVRVPPPA